MTPRKAGAVRRMTVNDLAQVLLWRNHPDVRAYMYTRHEISSEEHARWFAAANVDPARHLLIYEIDGVPLGFASLASRPGSDVADWGFYLAPGAPRGSGAGLGAAVLDHAFGAVGLGEVRGEALAFNAASIRLHEKLGFRAAGERRVAQPDGEGDHAVICFSMRRDQWAGGACPDRARRHRSGEPKP